MCEICLSMTKEGRNILLLGEKDCRTYFKKKETDFLRYLFYMLVIIGFILASIVVCMP